MPRPYRGGRAFGLGLSLERFSPQPDKVGYIKHGLGKDVEASVRKVWFATVLKSEGAQYDHNHERGHMDVGGAAIAVP